MLIGYARAAAGDNSLQAQVKSLRKLKCALLFCDEDVGGGMVHKPALMKALVAASPGDVLVVCQLDRLCRSLTHLIDLVRDVEARGLGLRSLKEGIDTKAGEERSFFHFIGALCGFEQDAGRERALANVGESQQPTSIGRPGTIKDIEWIRIKLMLDGDKSISQTAEDAGVSRQAIYYRLENEIQPIIFRQFKEALANGEDRGEVLRRMKLYGPAVKYLEAQEAKKAKRGEESPSP